MDPEKFNKKKMDDLFNQVFSFSVPINTYKFSTPKKETIQEELVRYYQIDEMLDSMTSYPTAERMLNDLFKKEI